MLILLRKFVVNLIIFFFLFTVKDDDRVSESVKWADNINHKVLKYSAKVIPLAIVTVYSAGFSLSLVVCLLKTGSINPYVLYQPVALS